MKLEQLLNRAWDNTQGIKDKYQRQIHVVLIMMGYSDPSSASSRQWGYACDVLNEIPCTNYQSDKLWIGDCMRSYWDKEHR